MFRVISFLAVESEVIRDWVHSRFRSKPARSQTQLEFEVVNFRRNTDVERVRSQIQFYAHDTATTTILYFILVFKLKLF